MNSSSTSLWGMNIVLGAPGRDSHLSTESANTSDLMRKYIYHYQTPPPYHLHISECDPGKTDLTPLTMGQVKSQYGQPFFMAWCR